MNKIYSLLLVFSCCSVFSIAQPTIAKDKTIGGTNQEFRPGILALPDGHFLLVGATLSGVGGDKTLPLIGPHLTNTETDLWLLYLDTGLAIQRQSVLGGTLEDDFSDMKRTRDGGFIIGSTSNSDVHPPRKTVGTHGDEDFWIIKLNSSGGIQWQDAIGSSNTDRLQSVIQTRSGGYIICGQSAGNISGDKTENSKGDVDYWVVKLDALGNKIWDKTIGSNNGDFIETALETKNGDIMLAGSSPGNTSADKTHDSYGDFDYWVVKLDSNGNKLWDRTLGGAFADMLYDAALTKDGGIMLAGSSASPVSATKSTVTKGGTYYWIVKLNANGTEAWDKSIGGAGFDFPYSIKADRDGNFLIVGYSNSGADNDKSEICRGANDYWLVKIDSAGNKLWDKTLGGDREDEGTAVQPTPDGGYVVAGMSASDVSGDKTEGPRSNDGLYDFWVVKLNAAGAVQNKTVIPVTAVKPVISSLTLYPNPAHNYLQVKTTVPVQVSLENNNHQVLQKKLVENNGIIDISKYPPGIYYVIEASGVSHQVIKQ